jgi:hypothetical protein
MAIEYQQQFPLLFNNLQFLQQINLANNSLSEFPLVEGSTQLRSINLKNNKISTTTNVSFDLDQLIRLDLSGNAFIVIESNSFGTGKFKGLQSLILDGNTQLTTIEKFGLSGMANLREISIQNNPKLVAIHPQAFHGEENEGLVESSPKIVRLGNNGLTSIGYGLLKWSELEILELNGNPWNCDCDLQWVPSFWTHQKTDASIFTRANFICDEPKPLHGIPVWRGDEDEMLCFSTTTTLIGLFSIIIITLIFITFGVFIGLSFCGLLPAKFKINPFGIGTTSTNGKPKYAKMEEEPGPGEMEWDSSDLP